MIETRTYRNSFNENRFTGFVVGYKDTDLWIGVDPASYCDDLKAFAEERIRAYRHELEKYLLTDPAFGKSHTPLKVKSDAPEIAIMMADKAGQAGIGPMGAVAGAFSEFIGKDIQKQFSINELVLENGGDLYMYLKEDLVLSVYAGTSPLSEKIGIRIPASAAPLGVCTSAGTVGPSKSYGKADAVMVACEDTLLADSLATALGNQVKTGEDIGDVMKRAEKYTFVKSLLIICGDKIGLCGSFEIQPIKA
ncbi:UPF0280 family protein [Puteibacter caeruleilacunae]|nr:UPF0280 family protein [Puteibacter caeruleilacunae]